MTELQETEQELRLIKLERTLTMMADEIKAAGITAVDYSKDSVNMSKNHWNMLRAMGEDAARLVRGEL